MAKMACARARINFKIPVSEAPTESPPCHRKPLLVQREPSKKAQIISQSSAGRPRLGPKAREAVFYHASKDLRHFQLLGKTQPY